MPLATAHPDFVARFYISLPRNLKFIPSCFTLSGRRFLVQSWTGFEGVSTAIVNALVQVIGVSVVCLIIIFNVPLLRYGLLRLLLSNRCKSQGVNGPNVRPLLAKAKPGLCCMST